MPGATFSSPAARINRLKGEILKHAIPQECLGITGMQKYMPKNVGDNVTYRRWLPYGGATTNSNTINRWVVSANAHIVSEGVTPAADTLVAQDITATQQQYGCLYQYTDKTADLYEDDVPMEMKKQTGERMGLVREMVRYAKLKGGTNVYYSGGTTRLTVDEKISLNVLRRVTRNLLANHGKQITQVLAPSPNFATAPVDAAFLVFVHTDAEQDIEDLPGFKHHYEYGQKKVVHPMEIGSCGRFRFIVSPELASIADSGASVGSTGLLSTGASTIDVYPFIVCAEDAWMTVALRGKDGFDVTHIPTGQKDKNDPHGQRGFIGSIGWFCTEIANQGWMAVIEAGVSALS